MERVWIRRVLPFMEDEKIVDRLIGFPLLSVTGDPPDIYGAISSLYPSHYTTKFHSVGRMIIAEVCANLTAEQRCQMDVEEVKGIHHYLVSHSPL